VLLNQRFPPAQRMVSEIEAAAQMIKQQVFIVRASNDAELDAGFAALMERRPGALLVAADPYFDTRRSAIIEFAAKQRLPAMYQWREYALAGGLASYGVDLAEAYRQFGVYAAKILKGEKPADLPVQALVKTELVINLKTAKALGFEFPATFIAR